MSPVLGMRTLRYERGQAGSSPARGTKIERVWRRGCAPGRHPGDTGSIPVIRSKKGRPIAGSNGVASTNSSARRGTGRCAPNATLSGSNPDGPTMTTDPLDEDARLLSVTWPVRVRLGRECCCHVVQRQDAGLWPRRRWFESTRGSQSARGATGFEPVKVIGWQRAMTLSCQGKVEILEEHDREVRAVSFTFKLRCRVVQR